MCIALKLSPFFPLIFIIVFILTVQINKIVSINNYVKLFLLRIFNTPLASVPRSGEFTALAPHRLSKP